MHLDADRLSGNGAATKDGALLSPVRPTGHTAPGGTSEVTKRIAVYFVYCDTKGEISVGATLVTRAPYRLTFDGRKRQPAKVHAMALP